MFIKDPLRRDMAPIYMISIDYEKGPLLIAFSLSLSMTGRKKRETLIVDEFNKLKPYVLNTP